MTTSTPPALRIGDLAGRTGVTVETLRYYEERGLLRPAGRRTSGYREYPADAPRLVHFIKRAQSLGFTLAEVKELVRLREAAWAGNATTQLRDATIAKLDDVDHRLKELNALRQELSAMLAACDAACSERASGTVSASDCPLVEALSEPGDPPIPGRRANEERSPAHRSRSTGRMR